jgi:hypothetical protein
MKIQRRLSALLTMVVCLFPVSLYAFSLHWPRPFSLTTVITDKTTLAGDIDLTSPLQSKFPQAAKVLLTTITEDDLQGKDYMEHGTQYKVIAKSTGVIDYAFQIENIDGYGSNCFVEVEKVPVPFVHPYAKIQNSDNANCQSHYSGGTLYIDVA